MHSLRNLHFPGVSATCLPPEVGGVPLSDLPKDTAKNLLACSPQPHLNAERQAEKAWIPFLKSFGITRQGD